MITSSEKPRISHPAIVRVGGFLDPESPTKRDWRLFAAHLGFQDSWIQKTESVCLPTGKSPTTKVLRAWQENLSVLEDLPVQKLLDCLEHMNRNDAASCVEQMIKDGSFLDPVNSSSLCKANSPSGFSGCELMSNQRCHHTCQTAQHFGLRSSNKSAQENSYHGPSHSFFPQGHPEKCINCEMRMKAARFSCEECKRPLHGQLTSATCNQRRQPKNGQSVVSLSSAISDLPKTSHRKNTNTWPLKNGDDLKTSAQDRHLSPCHVSSRRQHRPKELGTRFQRESNHHHQVLQDDDSLESRPFHSLVSTTSVDGMMTEHPDRASPSQTFKRASVLITYAYKNFKTAHALAPLLIDRGHEVTVDNRSSTEDSKQILCRTFTSVTYVIIIYTPEYIKEVTGNVKSPLNTRFIYDLMAEEFHDHGSTNLRFVPIIDYDRIDRDSIPLLLRNYPKQPTQYICKILDNSVSTPKQGEISIQRRVYSSH